MRIRINLKTTTNEEKLLHINASAQFLSPRYCSLTLINKVTGKPFGTSTVPYAFEIKNDSFVEIIAGKSKNKLVCVDGKLSLMSELPKAELAKVKVLLKEKGIASDGTIVMGARNQGFYAVAKNAAGNISYLEFKSHFGGKKDPITTYKENGPYHITDYEMLETSSGSKSPKVKKYKLKLEK